jgi:hypothetical protein
LVLVSLDYLYTPSADVDAAVSRCVDGLGAAAVWRIEAMGTLVAAVRVATEGPLLLFADHLDGETPIGIYRVADYADALARLRATGARGIRELELPPGPCAILSLAGARLGVYQLTRPRAEADLAARGSA